MYANVVTVTIEGRHDPQSARHALQHAVVPRFAQRPGFAGGYWLAPVDGKAMSLTLWETENDARDAARLAEPGSSPTPGITVDRVETTAVYAKASPVLRERVRQLSRQRRQLLERARQLQQSQRELIARARQRRQPSETGSAPEPSPDAPSDTGH